MTPSLLTLEGTRAAATSDEALNAWWDSLTDDQRLAVKAEAQQHEAERYAVAEEWKRQWNAAHGDAMA
jgi:hypothetical protein